MFKKTKADTQINWAEQVETRQDVQVMMHKLQALDERISELTCQYKELKTALQNKGKTSLCSPCEEHKTALQDEGKTSLCSQCGNEIEDGQEAVVRNMAGTETGRYHRDCLQELLKWKDP
jgi:membrane-bound inhibitor of C-type lysozyme